jgi:hypothetical protein
VSIGVDLLLAAGGVVIGRWIARTLRERGSTNGVRPAENPPSEAGALPNFPFRLGDVVVRTAERDEAWLAGALVFEEQQPSAVLFFAPEAGGDRALFARAGDPGVAWLVALSPDELALTNDPPHVVEHAGVRFERARRLPVRVRAIGTGAPHIGDRAVLAEYVGPGAERILVAVGSAVTLAWIGVALGKEGYDVLPGSKGSQPQA